jgi:hypothetical protein
MRYSIKVRPKEPGGWVSLTVFVYRGSSCIGVGASYHGRLTDALAHALSEVRYRRLCGQFEASYRGVLT